MSRTPIDRADSWLVIVHATQGRGPDRSTTGYLLDCYAEELPRYRRTLGDTIRAVFPLAARDTAMAELKRQIALVHRGAY